jgi:hypothetical protein
LEDALQKGRQFATAAPPVLRRYGGTVGLESGTAAVGVGALIEGIKRSQNGSTVIVDQIDPAEVPAGVAHGDLAEVTVPCRNLEAHSLERDRSIALTLTPLGFQAKRIP